MTGPAGVNAREWQALATAAAVGVLPVALSCAPIVLPLAARSPPLSGRVWAVRGGVVRHLAGEMAEKALRALRLSFSSGPNEGDVG